MSITEELLQSSRKGISSVNGVEKLNQINHLHFRDYIIITEPKNEIGILLIGGVTVLSIGNVLLMTGPPKGRKTLLASVLAKQSALRTAYIDTEQGRKHSWRTGQFIPNADVFHLRGEDQEEIIRVINECAICGDYKLMIIDNARDLLLDFNNVDQAGKLELLFKKLSEHLPVIVILHENKNDKTGQGHLGYALTKIAQTTLRVSLADVEDPAKGSFVECVHSRDEPFKQVFLSMEGVLSDDKMLRVGGKAMQQDDFFNLLAGMEYSREELLERIAEIFGIKASSAKNSLAAIRKACPGMIGEKSEGKKKVFFIAPIPKCTEMQ